MVPFMEICNVGEFLAFEVIVADFVESAAVHSARIDFFGYSPYPTGRDDRVKPDHGASSTRLDLFDDQHAVAGIFNFKCMLGRRDFSRVDGPQIEVRGIHGNQRR